MRAIIYIPSGLQTPELEIMLAKAQSYIDNNYQTIIATCSGGIGYACSFNIFGSKLICYTCKSMTMKGIKSLSGKFDHIETPARVESIINFNNFNFHKKALKKYRYKGSDVGQAAYSSYIGLTRDQDLEGSLAQWSTKKLLNTSVSLSSWIFDVFKKFNPEVVVLYNGRQNQYRPILRASQKNEIQTEVMEFSGQDSNCVYTYKNELPQNLNLLHKYIEKKWKIYKFDAEKIMHYYYKLKRDGGIINDSKTYTIGQINGLIPNNWDKSKDNIVIFNSSEDEFSALGGDYDKTLYLNQTDAIDKICKSLDNQQNIIIWLRIHPNLKNVGWRFAKRLNNLKFKYKNLRVIPANSSVDSYSLLDASSKVITFGSTMGMEAVYWGKPSILIGRCIYERLGSVYAPKTHLELIKLLKNHRLKKSSVTGAKKIAVFWCKGGDTLMNFSGNRTIGFNFKNYSLNKSLIEKLSFYFGKIIEKIILGKSINYYLRNLFN